MIPVELDEKDDILAKFVLGEDYKKSYTIYSRFSENWIPLMQVVEKIEKINSAFHGNFVVYIGSNRCTIQGTKLHLSIEPNSTYGFVYFDEQYADTKLEATYIACLNFINWFNKQDKDGFTTISDEISVEA